MVIFIEFPLFDSFEVATTEEYDNLLNGNYKSYHHIYVEASAHHNVFDEAQHQFHSQQIIHITFTDEHGDFIRLTPRTLSVEASFSRGHLFAKLPTDYMAYDVRITDDSIINQADKHSIAEWKSATKVRISKHRSKRTFDENTLYSKYEL